MKEGLFFLFCSRRLTQKGSKHIVEKEGRQKSSERTFFN